MKKIYLPVDDVNDYACYVVYDKDTIRAYYTKPVNEQRVNYTDFYINSHYLEKEGSQTFYNYNLPSCLPTTSLTTDLFYRFDLSQSLIIFTLLILIMFWTPLKLTWFRLFRRFN